MPLHQSLKTMSNSTLSLENFIKVMRNLKCLKSDYHLIDQMQSKRMMWVVTKIGNQSYNKTHFLIQDNSSAPCTRRVISRQVKQSRIRKSLEDHWKLGKMIFTIDIKKSPTTLSRTIKNNRWKASKGLWLKTRSLTLLEEIIIQQIDLKPTHQGHGIAEGPKETWKGKEQAKIWMGKICCQLDLQQPTRES